MSVNSPYPITFGCYRTLSCSTADAETNSPILLSLLGVYLVTARPAATVALALVVAAAPALAAA